MISHRWSLILVSILVVIISFLNFVVFFQFVKNSPGGNDSIPRWIGTRAWLFEGINPYSDEVNLRAQQMIYGRPAMMDEDQHKFVYPFYVILFYIPIAWLNFEWGRTIYMMVIEGAIIIMVVMTVRTYKLSLPRWLMTITIIISVLNYHSIRTIVLWQLAAISALLITLALWGIVNKHDILAGICLAMASIKPQMVFLIIPIVFLLGILFRRWKISLSLLGTLLFLFIVSVILLPTWFSDMVHQMIDYESYTHTVSPLNLLTHRIFPVLGDKVEIFLILLLLAWLIFEWTRVKNVESDQFLWTFSLSLVITNLIVVRTATTNYLMMFPALIYIIQKIAKSQFSQKNIWILMIELILFIGTWILFFITVQGREEQWQMYLPLPLFILVGLIFAKIRDNLAKSILIVS